MKNKSKNIVKASNGKRLTPKLIVALLAVAAAGTGAAHAAITSNHNETLLRG